MSNIPVVKLPEKLDVYFNYIQLYVHGKPYFRFGSVNKEDSKKNHPDLFGDVLNRDFGIIPAYKFDSFLGIHTPINGKSYSLVGDGLIKLKGGGLLLKIIGKGYCGLGFNKDHYEQIKGEFSKLGIKEIVIG